MSEDIKTYPPEMLKTLAVESLKPCPFCGKEVELDVSYDHLSGNGSYYINCFDCNLTMMESFIVRPYVKDSHADSEIKAHKRVIKRWNRGKS